MGEDQEALNRRAAGSEISGGGRPIPKSISIAGALIEPAGDWCRWVVRIRPSERASWERVLGIALPVEPLRSLSAETGHALWLGPDEWLVLMRRQHTLAFRDRCAQIDPTRAPASIVEVTNRNVGITLSGPRAAWILNAGCPLDLSTTAFPSGACTRTLLGKAEIVLWNRNHGSASEGNPVWHMECWRSFAPYVWTYLSHVAAECAAETL